MAGPPSPPAATAGVKRGAAEREGGGGERVRGAIDASAVIIVSDSEDDVGATADVERLGPRPRAAAAAAADAAATAVISGGALLAPLFRSPRAGGGGGGGGDACQRIVCIRHAVTVGYHVRDTPLAPEGRAAAGALFERPHARLPPWFGETEAVVVSPLTRAMQTAILAFGRSYHLVDASTAGEGAGGAAGGGGRRRLPLLVQPLVRERRATMGDIGSDGATLAAVPAFYPAAPQLAALPAAWWLDATTGAATSEHTGIAATAAAAVADSTALPPGVPGEPATALRARVERVRRWLRSLPYRTIAIVSHANFLAALCDSSARLPFCGVSTLLLRP